jgi:Nuclease-related domain
MTLRLNHKYWLWRVASYFFLVITLIGIGLSVYVGYERLIVKLLFLSIAISCEFMRRKATKQAKILRAGVEGEQKTTNLLNALPKQYKVLGDMNVTVNGRSSQLDHVVIGPAGVFVIETKNVSGKIVGKLDDTNWSQQKVDYKGKTYTKTLYNPIKQVSTHVDRVSALLNKANMNVPVKGIVYFSHKDAEVHMRSQDVKIFSFAKREEQALLQYVQRTNGKALTSQEVENVHALVKKSQ